MDKIALEKLKTLTILYAEDEERIRKKISDSLRYYVKKVIEAKDGEEAFLLYKRKRPDIIFTDIIMPKLDGLELVKKVRMNDDKTPIVIISAHTDKKYLLGAIDLHLEQYIIKPINLISLKKSLKKCLKVISKNSSITETLCEDYSYNLDKKIILHKNMEVNLTVKEVKLIELLLQNKNRVISYKEIENRVWEDEAMSENALKTLIKNLRHKLPKNFIKNLSGFGYRVQCD